MNLRLMPCAAAGLALLLAATGCSSSSVVDGCRIDADCPEGQVCDVDTSKCREALECPDLECAAHQLCQPATAEQDASCLPACETGYGWNAATEACDPAPPTCVPDVPGSILQDCTDSGRQCLEPTVGQAECGPCLQTGWVLDEQTQRCRAPLTCANLDCEPGLFCIEPAEGDAYCSETCVGPNGEVGLADAEGNCKLCPACDDPTRGEAGPYLDGLTAAGRCICRTAAGYYWSEGAPTGVIPCDADGDGWVRIGARRAIESADPVIRENARCSLRTIGRFVLHDLLDRVREVTLGDELALYESQRNDDQAEIDRLMAAGDDTIPPYGRALRAVELNSLTKACVSVSADYNDNGVQDVAECQGMSRATMLDAYQPFVDYAYFIELHRGRYEGGAIDAYHIYEKSRLSAKPQGWRVPLQWPPPPAPQDDNSYWRECTVLQDTAYLGEGDRNQGMDFARLAADPDAGWFGMNHHSQFKCVNITNTPGPNPAPNVLTKAEVMFPTYQVNACGALDGGAAPADEGWDAENPVDPLLVCAPLSAGDIPENGVRWIVSGFFDYPGPNAGYVRGCVNECSEVSSTCAACGRTRESCDGFQEHPEFTHCVGNPDNFGSLYCGCEINYGGEDCSYVCPGSDPTGNFDPVSDYTSLFVQADFSLAPRRGYWLCGGLTQTAHDPADDPLLCQQADCSSGYRLSGQVPAGLKPEAEFCQDSVDCTTGYSLY